MQITPDEVAAKYGLQYLPRKEWHGPNPFDNGATDDGFILFERGNAYDRKLDKSYSAREVSRLTEADKRVVIPAHRRPIKAAAVKSPQPRKPKKPIDYSAWEKTYYHYDKNFSAYAAVIRLDPPEGLLKENGRPYSKEFRQQRCLNGVWEMKAPEIPILYNYDSVAHCHHVLVVEGEKAADRFLLSDCFYETMRKGYAVTTNAGGTGNTKLWKQLAPTLAGKNVVILPDNDAPGERHAQAVLGYVSAVATARIVRLPDLPPKGDVVDWLETHSIDELFYLIEGSYRDS